MKQLYIKLYISSEHLNKYIFTTEYIFIKGNRILLNITQPTVCGPIENLKAPITNH